MAWLPVVVFGVALTAVLLVYWAFIVRPEGAERRSLERRMKVAPSERLARAGLLIKAPRLSEIGHLDRVLQSVKHVLSPLQELLTQSDVRTTVGTLLMLVGSLFLMGYVIGAVLLRMPLVGLALGGLLAFVPFMVLQHRRRRRLDKFEEQFPEAIDLLARALRAGHAFTTGLSMVGDEMPQPVGGEFRLMYDRQNFGMPVPDALRAFAERVPIIDARFFATAVLTQRESGGNLSEVLDNLSGVIRERFKVKRQVRVVTAHGRMTGWVLAALPPALAAALFTLNPQHILTLVRDPLGVQMIVLALALQIIGTVAIRKLVNIEY